MHRTPGHLGQIGFALLIGLLVGSIAATGAEKAIAPERANPRLAPSLQLLAEIATSDPSALQPRAEGSGIVLDGDHIDVIIEPTSGRVTSLDKSAIRALGGTIEAQSDNLVRASVPVNRLVEIADRVSGVAYIREPYKPRPLVVTSQGVSLTGASAFHSAGYTGAGVKVAIIDLGFDGLADAQAAGELAHVAYTWNYITGASNVETTGEIHGTGVAEIVADMAPGASLYLLLIGDEVDLANAAQYCIDHGIRVINHSVGWYNTDYYDGTGDVAGVANDARDNDILWVNAAGNEGSDGHWQGAFTDTDGDDFLDFGTGSDYVDGDTRDEGARIYAGSGDVVRVYMTWNDWTASDQDYDLYLYNSSGAVVASSTGYQGGYQQPTEAIYYSVATSGYYEIVVHNYDAPAKPAIEFFAYLSSGADPDLEYHMASSSIIEPANSAKVVAVGAIYRSNWTSGPIESFSSRGPSNASLYATSRVKPDLCGVDGVLSYTYGSFYGTSAASPHVAGAAALLLSEEPTRTADELQSLLEGTAVDLGTAGKDNTYGSGRLNLELTPTGEPGMVGYWALDEVSGTTASDSSGNGNTGTVSGASWVSGHTGNGLSFDGVNDYVAVPDAVELRPTSALTVDLWVRFTEIGKTWIVDKSSDYLVDSYRHGYLLRTDSTTSTLIFRVGNGTTYGDVTASITTAVWYHVVAIYDGAQLYLYVNDVLRGTAALTGSISYTSTGNLYLGSMNGTAQYTKAVLDEVKIYNTAELPELLSAEERAVAGVGERLRARVRPNPASDVAVFELVGADAEHIRVMIWNLAGRRVFDSNWVPGSRIDWCLCNEDGDRLAAGAYIYRLTAELAGGAAFSFPPQKVFLLP